MGPGGRPADWYDLQQASAEGRRAHARAPAVARRRPLAVWHDFAAGALTLVDGGDRDKQLPAIRVGNQLGVLRSAGTACRTGAGDFTVTSGR